jgi:8-oxo-dGTP diphosphatase
MSNKFDASIIRFMPANDQGVHPERFQIIPRVLVFITHQQQVLLIKGAATKRIWANKYNGIGGHVERGEDIISAARREILEETGLNVDHLCFRGSVVIDAGQPTGIGIFVFTAVAPTIQTISSSEGTLEWVSIDRLLQVELVEDLPTLLPKVLAMNDADPPFFGRYWYEATGELQMAFESD